jgi:flagellar basal body-associated protein FliL
MMEFIKNHNPAYYEKLMNRNEPSYIEEFYKFYTKRGNSLFVLSGIIIVVIVINNAFMMSYMMVSEERVPSKIKHDEKVEEKTKAQRPEENQQV